MLRPQPNLRKANDLLPPVSGRVGILPHNLPADPSMGEERSHVYGSHHLVLLLDFELASLTLQYSTGFTLLESLKLGVDNSFNSGVAPKDHPRELATRLG